MRNLVKGLLEIQIYYINWKPLINIVGYKFQEFQQISKTRSLPNEPMLRFSDQFIFLNVFNNTIPYYRLKYFTYMRSQTNWSIITWQTLFTLFENRCNICLFPITWYSFFSSEL